MEAWRPAPASPRATAGEIQVWRISLEQPPAPLLPLLSAGEAARAARFRYPRHRRRFIVRRGALRAILGRYLARAPAGLRFANGPQGKPALRAFPSLCFNLTHAHELALVAIAWERAVGIDLEHEGRPPARVEALAARFFAPREAAALRRLPAGARPRAFLEGWTRKEAYLKARGEGLARDLDRFAVSLGPAAPPALLWDADDPDAPAQWQLQALPPGAAYVATLAAAGRGWTLRLWSY